MEKILIATSNPGKFQEITLQLKDLPFILVNLKDAGLHKLECPEPFDTLRENASYKAEFYGNKSKLMTLAEDTGFFVPALGSNDPGISAKRYAPSEKSRNAKLLAALQKKRGVQRTVYSRTAMCLYNPTVKSFHLFHGETKGIISLKEEGSARVGMGYDTIFYYPPLKKFFSEMSMDEKNMVSHRGRAVAQAAGFLFRNFAPRQLVVVVGLIIKDRRMLLTKRRDPIPALNKWQFPGGGVERNESVLDCLKREMKEETGLEVKALELLPAIEVVQQSIADPNIQLFFVAYICQAIRGKLVVNQSESSEYGWFTYAEALKLNWLPMNKKCIQDNQAILKKYID